MSTAHPFFKIQKLSKILQVVALVAMLGTPICVAIFWIAQGQIDLTYFQLDLLPKMVSEEGHLRPLTELQPIYRIGGFLVSLIPAGITMVICYYLAKLFGLFAKMEIFTQASVMCIQRMGWTLLAGQFLHPLYVALMSLVLSISNPEGERFIAVEMGLAEIKMIAVALGILCISWIMEEGRKLQEEQAATV